MKKLVKLIVFFVVLIAVIPISGCGTHGSIKGYRYSASKDDLQKAVMAVIRNNSNIYRDSSLDHLGSSPALDSLGKAGDFSAGDNYYNDVKHYVTIKISSGDDVNEYTFRYYGDDTEWVNSSSAEIFICYVHDKNGKGGSAGNGGVSRKMAKEFTRVFDSEFITRLDNELRLQHIETD